MSQEPVVLTPFLRVCEDRIRLVDFLHPGGSLRVVFVSVRVISEGKGAVGLLDFLWTGLAVHTQNPVVVFLRHAFPRIRTLKRQEAAIRHNSGGPFER